MASSTYYLRNLGLLQGLPDGAARALEQSLRVEHFARKATIFAQGEPAEEVFLLAQGTVELVRHEAGREAILLVLAAGELMDEPAESAGAGHTVQARALTDCVVCSIGRGELEALVRQYPPLGWRLLTWVGRTTRQAYQRIHSLSSCEVPDKLLAVIRYLAERHGVPTHEGLLIDVRLTQHELAALIGSCREAVSRGLKSLRDRGVISMDSRHITLRVPA